MENNWAPVFTQSASQTAPQGDSRMKKRMSKVRIRLLVIASPLMMLTLSTSAQASTAYGDLNNFDVFNDTGQECHGFEIELEDIHSTDITYTFDWNHYGAPTVTEDNSVPGHPKVIIRYAAKYVSGAFTAYTAVPTTTPSPTNGHMCTDISVNFGCEHFGVGHYGAPTAIRHNWLIKDPTSPGTLIKGPPVNVATPSWTYYPPAGGQPAVVQAVILAPPPPPAPVYEFGDATWVKSIVTVSHNNAPVALDQLVSDDPDDPNDENWAHGEPDEVEVEWHILQTEFNNPAGANNELAGGEEGMPGGDEVITRRYEFYKYTGPLDPETNEALCDNYPQISDPADPSYKPECDPAAVTVLGDYIGAQMAGFDVEAPLGLIDHLQDGEQNQPYTPRTVVVGGNTPYIAQVTAGALPPDLMLDPATGVLSGTPSVAGQFAFTVGASDADLVQVSKAYTVVIAALPDLCTGVICFASDACHMSGVCDPTTGMCSDPPAPDGTACDDGDACTEGDTCLGGTCLGGAPVLCDDNNACTQDTCKVGACVYHPIAGCCKTDADCADVDACTLDLCQTNACDHRPIANCCNTDAECVDVDACTLDLCVNHVCTHDAIPACCNADAECADADACTTDVCVGNVCENRPIAGCCNADAECVDADACTLDLCVNHVCTHDAIPACCNTDAECADADVCTADTCVDHLCQHTAVVGCCSTDGDCSDADICTADTCVNQVCDHAAVAGCCRTDAECDDGNPCTRDTCQATVCVRDPIVDCCTVDSQCADSDPCTLDSCNVAAGQCVHQRILGCCVADAECVDADLCTIDTCVNQLCVHTPTPSCCTTDADCDDGDDDDDCTIDRCQNGVCTHESVPDCCREDGDCEDEDACTTDRCVGSVCQHTAITDCCHRNAECDDGIACTRDRCVDHVCRHTPRNSRCSDRQPCNGEEVCDPTVGCRPGTPVNCDDDIACTVDKCNERSGACQHTPDHAVCGDAISCTRDRCVPWVGCVHKPDDSRCDDGLFCNGEERCNLVSGCRPADHPPCPGQFCDESRDRCRHRP